MATGEAVTPVARPSFLRRWLPLIVLSLGLVAGAAVWLWPSPDLIRLFRVLIVIWAIVPLTVLLLLFWWLFLSGRRWWVRIGGVLLLAGAVIGTLRVEQTEFDGDLMPIISFRWSATRDERLEADRQRQAREPAPAAVTTSDSPTDFPEYRGRRRDGVVGGKPIVRDGKLNAPRLMWRQPCGGGYAAIVVAGNAAVTIEQRRDREAVVCYDTATGRERWAHAYPARFFEPRGGEGPRATPTIAGGDVFALGAAGRLLCLELATGREKWAVETLVDNANLEWGMCGSPLVYDNVVVVNPGTQRDSAARRALVAYDRATGKDVWQTGSYPAGYSSPMLATLTERRQVLIFDGHGLAGHDAATGQELWRYPWETQQGINVAQPLVLEGDRVFVSSGYGVGGALLQVKASGPPELLWKNRYLRCRFTSPVAYRGHIYGLDEGTLVCLDEKTGERRGRGGRYGNGQLLLVNDVLLVLAESGTLVAVETVPDRLGELGSFKALAGGKTWNTFAVVDGKVYVRNHEEMACYDLSGETP